MFVKSSFFIISLESGGFVCTMDVQNVGFDVHLFLYTFCLSLLLFDWSVWKVVQGGQTDLIQDFFIG